MLNKFHVMVELNVYVDSSGERSLPVTAAVFCTTFPLHQLPRALLSYSSQGKCVCVCVCVYSRVLF